MNELKHITEFEASLKNYALSDSARQLLKDFRLVLLVAPSSSGRNTIIRELVKTGDYHFIISDTTRHPRVNDGVPEVDGVDYWFRSEEHVLEDVQEGHFLEAAIIHRQQVSGISIRELRRAHDDNKIAITDVEPVGAGNIHRLKPDTRIIFVVPPSFPIWIARLHHRGLLPEDEVRRRLESSLKEFDAALRHEYYDFIINDQLEDTVVKVDRLSRTGKGDADEQARARQTVQDLLQDTEAYLTKG